MNEQIGLLFAKYCDVKDLQPPHYNALSREGLEKLLADESFPLGAVVSGKNGVEFKFTFGDKVWINDLQCFGRVLSCWHTRSGKQYELRYFVDGKHETSYLFEDELSEKKP